MLPDQGPSPQYFNPQTCSHDLSQFVNYIPIFSPSPGCSSRLLFPVNCDPQYPLFFPVLRVVVWPLMNLRKVNFHFTFFLLGIWNCMSKTRSLSIDICIPVTHKLHFQPRLLFWVPESSIFLFKYLSSTTIQRFLLRPNLLSFPSFPPNNNWFCFNFPHLRNGYRSTTHPGYLSFLHLCTQFLLIVLPWYFSKESISLSLLSLAWSKSLT